MKNIKIYIIEALMLIYLLIYKFVILKYFLTLSTNINIVVLSLFLIVSIFLLGFKKDNSATKYNICQYVIIFCIMYYIFIYLFGLFVGFLKNPYSLQIFPILKNIIPVILTIIISELIRHILLKEKGTLNIVLVTLIMTIIEIFFTINSYSFNSFEGIFNFVSISLLPAIFKNIMLTYMNYKTDYVPTIIYRMFFELPLYIIPIIPDLGDFINSTVNVIFPFLMFFKVLLIYNKKDHVRTGRKKRNYFIIVPVIILMVSLIVLISGVFKYHMIAIGSESMVPTINKGDAVIIEKLNSKQYSKIEKGMILAFKHNGLIIVHRVVSVTSDGDKYIIITKGDNNKANDNWKTTENEIIGIVNIKIPYIGIPSVRLSELLYK